MIEGLIIFLFSLLLFYWAFPQFENMQDINLETPADGNTNQAVELKIAGGVVDSGAQDLIIDVRLSEVPVVCPYCKDLLLQEDDEKQACSFCRTIAHLDCWQKNNNRCSVFRCHGNPQEYIKEASRPNRDLVEAV